MSEDVRPQVNLNRLCEPGCPTPDLPHVEPAVDWIGDCPLMHGERSESNDDPLPHDVPGGGMFGSAVYCLCGHPDFTSCPGQYGEGSILGLTIRRSDDEEPS